MTRVLVVDDDTQLLRALKITLTAHGYTLLTAKDGTEALKLASSAHPAAVVLDLGLPDLPGSAVIDAIRGWSAMPIIVLSARTGSDDKVRALDAGADDYVTKPFGMSELLARLRAAIRRGTTTGVTAAPAVDTATFTIDLAAKKVTCDGAETHLTPTEWAILTPLVRHPGTLISQRQLLHAVWGPGYEQETHYLRVYLTQLRRKLEPTPAKPRYLITEPGMGYRFEPDS